MSTPVPAAGGASPPCPLCGSSDSTPSWRGGVRFLGEVLTYRACGGCGSHYLRPMPGERMLGQMYGPSYESAFEADPAIDDPRAAGFVNGWLDRLGAGVFLDYGCGSGALLAQVARKGWQVLGLERDPEVARRVATQTGLTIVSDVAGLPGRGLALADVVHLGDVIEHLPEPHREMLDVLKLIKPGGLLLAQGPLEAHPNLFNLGLKAARALRRSEVTDMPPFHVLLATAGGQRRLFERLHLEERELQVWEVSWPAPSRLGLPDLRSPRRIALWGLRRASQLLGSLRPRWGGNRYFYAGAAPREGGAV